MKSAFDQASASWATLTGDAKAAAATACKTALDATKQASAACGQ